MIKRRFPYIFVAFLLLVVLLSGGCSDSESEMGAGADEASIEETYVEVKEQVEQAYSVIDSYYERTQVDPADASYLSMGEAQFEAKEAVRILRHGPESEYFFWINDFDCMMLMHPTSMNQGAEADWSLLEDKKGNLIVPGFVSVCKEVGEGFCSYWWLDPDDESKLVERVCYVKAHDGWDWIVGTSVYAVDF